MNLNVSERNGRTYLYIEKSYRNALGKPRKKNVLTIGYIDELGEHYDDPIAHFRDVARKMTEAEEKTQKVTLSFHLDDELPMDSDSRKNLGYAAILKIYHELELDRFFKNKARHQGFEYNTNSIMQLLIISRILSPGSKKKAVEEKGRYFERFNFALHDVYRSLSHFATLTKEIQRHIHERIAACYGSDTRVVYYDVTNFYFEIDQEDDLRKRGVSKEHRKDPIVQMGLAMDANGIPLHYELFAGNTQDKSTFRSVIGEVRRNYNTGRVIVVADMGIITGDNIYYLVGGEKKVKPLNGYVFSFSIRGAMETFQEYVLNPDGYRGADGKPAGEDAEFKIKSRVYGREINVTMQSGKTAKKMVYEKQVVFWGKKYADKARADREKTLMKSMSFVENPGKYSRATSYGAAKYVGNIEFDKKTGEIAVTDKKPFLDQDKIANEEKYDGYYAIVTSEREMPDQEIIDTYRGLWEIEETFRVTKGDLEARPAYVSLQERIEAHFLTCFIALVIMRLLQKQTGRIYSCGKIADCLNRISCVNEQDNLYLFNYRSEVSDAIGRALGIDFTKKRMRLAEIKNLLANSKKK